MVERLLERAYRRLGPRYPRTAVVLQIQLGYLLWLLTVAVLAIYVEMSAGEFLRLFVSGLAFFVAHNLFYAALVRRLVGPVVAWLSGERTKAATAEAWRAAVRFLCS